MRWKWNNHIQLAYFQDESMLVFLLVKNGSKLVSLLVKCVFKNQAEVKVKQPYTASIFPRWKHANFSISKKRKQTSFTISKVRFQESGCWKFSFEIMMLIIYRRMSCENQIDRNRESVRIARWFSLQFWKKVLFKSSPSHFFSPLSFQFILHVRRPSRQIFDSLFSSS